MIQPIFWRKNLGWIAGLVVFPLVWFLLGDYVRDGGQLYRIDLSSKATAATFISLTVVAAISAWEGARVTATVRNVPGITRSELAMALVVCGPAILSASLAYMLAIGARFLAVGVQPPLPTLSVFVGIVALHFGMALGGVSIGSVSPEYLAAPLAGIAAYGSFIILGIASQGDLRLLFGQQYDCCALDESPSNIAIMVPIATAVGLGAVSIALLAWRWRHRASLPTVTAVVGAAVLGWSVWAALNAGSSGTITPRTGDMVCQTSETSSIEYCVWPEHGDLLDKLLATGDVTFARWERSTPLLKPVLITERAIDGAREEALSIAIGPRPQDEDVIAALARGTLPQIPDCVGGWPNSASYTQLMAWLLLTADVDPHHPYVLELRAMTPPTEEDPIVAAERLMNSSSTEQQTWLESTLDAFSSCEESLDSAAINP